MHAEEFVDIVRELTIDDSINIVQSNLIKPSGRKPDEMLVAMSKWYNSLADNDKSMLLRIIGYSAETSTFQFLCLLDGSMAIEGKEKGALKLFYEKGNDQVLLNGQGLHDFL
jgi:hypothetical protein